MFYKGKKNEISDVKQSEDKYTRFDYGKTRVDIASGIIGQEENLKDSR